MSRAGRKTGTVGRASSRSPEWRRLSRVVWSTNNLWRTIDSALVCGRLFAVCASRCIGGQHNVLCAIFDAIFPPFGFLAAFAHASPWPISGSLAGTAVGLALFTAIGFTLGALYGAASEFWSKRLR